MKSKKKLVSVIVPNYNHAPFIEKRLDSIFNQTFQDFEVILLDDCSTDNSWEILCKYKNHPKVTHCIKNEVNSGSTFRQWIKGLDLAKGEWIWIAESDDWSEPTLLEELIKGVSSSDAIVLSFCGSITFCENEILYTSKSERLNEVKDGISFVKEKMIYNNTVFNASMAIFKKHSLHNISLEYTSYKFSGDWLFWIMIAQTGQVFISGKYLNYFRKHGADVSGKSILNGTYYTEYSRIADYLLRNNLINIKKYHHLLFLKYQELKVFGGDERLKKDLLSNYVALIGKKKIIKIKIKYQFHKYYVLICMLTPDFFKYIFHTILFRK